jgi:hypothetical protein
MTTDDEILGTMGAEVFATRLRRLAVRDGMTFATLAALGGSERAELHATIARQFQPGRSYDRAAVNRALRDWLQGVGAMVESDHANLRRLPVDTRVMTGAAGARTA